MNKMKKITLEIIYRDNLPDKLFYDSYSGNHNGSKKLFNFSIKKVEDITERQRCNFKKSHPTTNTDLKCLLSMLKEQIEVI